MTDTAFRFSLTCFRTDGGPRRRVVLGWGDIFVVNIESPLASFFVPYRHVVATVKKRSGGESVINMWLRRYDYSWRLYSGYRAWYVTIMYRRSTRCLSLCSFTNRYNFAVITRWTPSSKVFFSNRRTCFFRTICREPCFSLVLFYYCLDGKAVLQYRRLLRARSLADKAKKSRDRRDRCADGPFGGVCRCRGGQQRGGLCGPSIMNRSPDHKLPE
jgi:hypothetical protein